MKRELLDSLQSLRARGEAAVLLSAVSGRWQTLTDAHAAVQAGDPLPDEAAEELAQTVAEVLRSDVSRVIQTAAGDEVFVQAFNPALRLIVVGAVHIAQSLAPMAVLAGYDVTVVDPRRSFAADERFPGVAMHKIWPDDALAELQPDARTAIITLTHDPKIDDPALHAALKTPAFYIGSLGSPRTHAKRVERLTEAGFSAEQIARIHAPLGLDIGARSPAEIAISALAELTEALRRAPR